MRRDPDCLMDLATHGSRVGLQDFELEYRLCKHLRVHKSPVLENVAAGLVVSDILQVFQGSLVQIAACFT